MRIHRFFIEQTLPSQGRIVIANDDLAHQWRNVLRFQVGHEVILFDNSGKEFRATIHSLTNREAEVEILDVVDRTNKNNAAGSGGDGSSKPSVYLYLSLAKRDSFEWTLEKGTELGVSGFVPVLSERSEKKTVRLDRSQDIVTEASEQSGRVTVPTVTDQVTLEQALAQVCAMPQAFSFALDPRGSTLNMSELQRDFADIHGNRLNMFIGPEGGFSPAEIALFKTSRIPVFSIGEQVLRAETAAIAAASIFLLSY